MDLHIIWFILLVVLIIGYAILDGFDLGVGILHLFIKDEREKRISINSIGPVWDGNEVWLLTAGGSLFAAFPVVYATVFSGFYLAFILLLVALIFRAVSLEFRGKVDSIKWRNKWDLAFGLGSLLPSILFGVAIGNILRGIPINESGLFTGNFLSLLNPYALSVGLLSMTLFLMHGAIYLTIKSEGDLQNRTIKLINRAWMIFVLLYIFVTIFSLFESKYLFGNLLSNPLFWGAIFILFLSIIAIPVLVKSMKFGFAFVASSSTIFSMITLMAISLFPRLVPSSINLDFSLTIYNASSSEITLYTMLIIALVGMPLVIGYTAFIYSRFKGKVTLDEHSY